jgi:hypothetical protein
MAGVPPGPLTRGAPCGHFLQEEVPPLPGHRYAFESPVVARELPPALRVAEAARASAPR